MTHRAPKCSRHTPCAGPAHGVCGIHYPSARLTALLAAGALLLPLVLAWLPGDRSLPLVSGPECPIAWGVLAKSLAVAAAAAAMAVAVGTALAAALVLTDLPGRALWATALALPFLCPRAVWALGQVYCYGPGGMSEQCLGGAWRTASCLSDAGHYLVTTLVLAEVHAPLAMFIIGRGLGRLQHAGLDSAILLLRPAVFVRWLGGAIRQEAAAAFLLVLALALGEFAVPHVLQCRLYTLEIYGRVINYLDPAGAMRLSWPLLAVTLMAALGVALAERRQSYVSAVPSPARAPVALGRRAWLVGALLAAYLCLTAVFPLAAMLAECRSPACFLSAVRGASREVQNTLWLGVIAALIACAAGLAVGPWNAARRRPVMDVLVMAPLGVAPLLLGLACLRCLRRDWPLDLTVLENTNALAALALAVRGWPFVARMIADGQRRIAPQWHETASLAGMGWWRRWRRITGPLLAGHLAGGAVVAYVLVVGDVEISQMLCAPGSGTLAVRMCAFLHFGPAHVAANLALLQLLIAVVPVFLYFLLTNRCVPVS